MTSPRIDAHQHFWCLDRGDYGWLTPDLQPINRDVGPADLDPHLLRHGIAASIVVQAAPTEAETLYLLDIARITPSVAGVVGWIDFEAPDAVARVVRLAREPLLLGLRPMVQDIADDDWLLRSSHVPVLQAMVEHKLVFDALVKPRHLERLHRLAARHPRLPVVIDHGAKPSLDRGGALAEEWRDGIAALASLPNVHCKLSGLLTNAGLAWCAGDILPAMAHLLRCFGPRRLIWGSDWPVLELAGGYDAWAALCNDFVAPLEASDRALIMGGNAVALYLSCRGRPPAC